jgi:hypothetical protein
MRNRFSTRCNAALRNYRVYFCPKTGKLYPLTGQAKGSRKADDEKLTWWQKTKVH